MTIDNISEKFSGHFKNTLKVAAEIAAGLGHDSIEPGHILQALLTERGSVGGEFLLSLKLDEAGMRGLLEKSQNAVFTDDQPLPIFSSAAKKIIEKAAKLAYLNKHKYIGTEHLLTALIESSDSLIVKIFNANGLAQPQLLKQSALILKTASKLPEVTENFQSDGLSPADDQDGAETGGALDYFGRNLCAEKIQAGLDPVIGREPEIARIIEVLSRRGKNNPLLLGDPGVGKTAIIEGLAKKIYNQEVPEALAGKKIYSLDLASIVAGTSYRGEFEQRLKEIVWETENRPEVILFIDEIHQIVGAGSAGGSMDAANVLKPALARGDLHVIGATTFSDFRKTLENDAALARRFQKIIIDEPTAAMAERMLSGVKKYFENFHQVEITDEAIKSAVNLSQKYLPEKFLPDKAIDLIDEASAVLKANREPSKIEAELKQVAEEVKGLENRLRQLILEDDFEGALDLKNSTAEINGRLAGLKAKISQNKAKPRGQVTGLKIAQIVAKITNIPADDLIQPEMKRVLTLENELKREIIGQTAALDTLSAYLKRAKAGLSPDNRPLASFLFVGPSGVGKTHTARLLAKKFFGDEKALVKIDMSEYGEKFNASKLIGAPAGYVGYKESGQLTEKIKHRPYSLVLLDEIEKANPEIFDLLLAVLEDGYLTDAAGSKINFSQTIIIMTSNLGSQFYNGQAAIGFNAKDDPTALTSKVLAEVKRAFKPEFLNRLDKIICFNNLNETDLEKIVGLELEKLTAKLQRDRGLKLVYQPAAIAALAKKSFQAESGNDSRGARNIRAVIRDEVETPLADKLLGGKMPAGKTLRLGIKNGIISLS
ncbi:MAG: ATP-dependent Clp protease ATP-binding subunit [Patescibacteria group bacterium]